MTHLKQQFIAELEPLLIASEQAIVAGNTAASRRLSLRMLEVARKYADKLDPADFRDALNNPTATAIAKRLGVQP
ncbi:hypothetical protein [Bradyrhizobium elkanii]|uniref:hypothetical protein n=1 Tax=Bradyrhizobium elkanii TaxID=29448 RepID=UPI000426EC35|nr:hypothetical protein [Bradyrhizobium elkanii]